jgi:hypothetical protein
MIATQLTTVTHHLALNLKFWKQKLKKQRKLETSGYLLRVARSKKEPDPL